MSKTYSYNRVSTHRQSLDRQIRNALKLYPDAIIITETYTGTKFQGRKEFDKLLKIIKTGDTIVFDSVSRMSRNADEGVALYMELYDKGINLVFIKEPHIDTDTYKSALSNKISLVGDDVDEILKGVNSYLKKLAQKQIRLAFEQSEKEVEDLIHKHGSPTVLACVSVEKGSGKEGDEGDDLVKSEVQRTREGIETARLNGKQIGQKQDAKLITKKSIAAKKVILEHAIDFGGTLKDVEVIKLTGLSRNTYYKYKRELLAEMS